MNCNSKELDALVKGRIVTLRGISGAMTDVAAARAVPSLVQMRAMSGLVFNLAYEAKTDTFTFEEA